MIIAMVFVFLSIQI